MKIILILNLVLCISMIANAKLEPQFTRTVRYAYGVVKKTMITCSIDNKRVGFVQYSNIPWVGYIVYNLYIHPEHRHKGYATQLLAYVSDVLKQSDARVLYIQPGPFELSSQEIIIDYTDRLKGLVTLYTYCGFKRAPLMTRICARILYGVLALPEDADYLMVRYL